MSRFVVKAVRSSVACTTTGSHSSSRRLHSTKASLDACMTTGSHTSSCRLHSTKASLDHVENTIDAAATTLPETSLDKEATSPPREAVDLDPLKHHDYFGVRDLVTVQDLFDARVHLGHKLGSRDPYMTPFLFGTRLGMDIFDLNQTLPLLQEALNFTAHVAYRAGAILFLSRHLQTLTLVESAAKECGEYAHCREWKGGTFTNATIQFGAVTRLPDLCIFLSTHDTVFRQHFAVIETAKMNIPTIGVLDSSCDPRLITYPVPGNDDTPSAVELYCKLFKQAILKGKEKAKQDGESE